MTLQEMQQLFGTSEGYFYKVARNKSDMEVLTDLDQLVYTATNGNGLFVRVFNPVTHPDYTLVTE